jgi:hypothetical protein
MNPIKSRIAKLKSFIADEEPLSDGVYSSARWIINDIMDILNERDEETKPEYLVGKANDLHGYFNELYCVASLDHRPIAVIKQNIENKLDHILSAST